MFQFDPLLQFHNMLRVGRASGYPNLQMGNPHPYEMAMNAANPRPFPFRYAQGRPSPYRGSTFLARKLRR